MQIIVATPGRLIDLINRGVVNLTEVHTVILDEADEMLNMGFVDDINDILTHVPDNRKMLMFSATMPKEIARIAQRFDEQSAGICGRCKTPGPRMCAIYAIWYMRATSTSP